MIKDPGFYWAFDEDLTPQPIEILGNGKCLVLGVEAPLPENHFAFIATEKICPPGQTPYEGDIVKGTLAEMSDERCTCSSGTIYQDQNIMRCGECNKIAGSVVDASAPSVKCECGDPNQYGYYCGSCGRVREHTSPTKGG